MPKNKKAVDYQLDLTPFISLLSVCICFLLLTVAWFQVGALSVKQVMGGVSSEKEKQVEKASLWIYMKGSKNIEVRLQKGKRTLSRKLISSSGEETLNFSGFNQHIIDLKKEQSALEEAFIFPKEDSVYEDIIKVMDGLRQAGVFSMGLSPI